MRKRDWLMIDVSAASAVAALGLTGNAARVAFAGGGAKVEMTLQGDVAAPKTGGKVLFEDNGTGQRQLQVEVLGATEAAGQTLGIRMIDRAALAAKKAAKGAGGEQEKENESEKETDSESECGKVTLDAKGNGKVRLETKNGDKVPQTVNGQTMKLRLTSGRSCAQVAFA